MPQPRCCSTSRRRVPCVVKAPDRQGQRGLTFVRREAELPAAIEAAVAASRNGSFIVEELVEGPEVTVKACLVDGVFHPLTRDRSPHRRPARVRRRARARRGRRVA